MAAKILKLNRDLVLFACVEVEIDINYFVEF